MALCVPLGGADAHHAAILKGSGGTGSVAGPATGFWCAAITIEPAASTSVDRCELYVDGHLVAVSDPVAMAGQVAVTGGAAIARPLTSTTMVCWSVSADMLLGGRHMDVGCSAR